MIANLAKNDKLWREKAFIICKDKQLADDLVQEMYLYFSNKNMKVNNYYVIVKIRCLFLDYLKSSRNKQTTSIESFHYLEDKNKPYEINDKELKALSLYDNLDYFERELINEHLVKRKSLRDIEKEFPLINYAYAHHVVKRAIAKITNNLNG